MMLNDRAMILQFLRWKKLQVEIWWGEMMVEIWWGEMILKPVSLQTLENMLQVESSSSDTNEKREHEGRTRKNQTQERGQSFSFR